IQGNKTRFIAERFHWAHTVDRARIARRLAEQRPYFAPPLNVLIQVNLDGEPQKGGVAPNEVEGLAERIAAFDALTLRGLMTLPPAGLSSDEKRAHFGRPARIPAQAAARGLAGRPPSDAHTLRGLMTITRAGISSDANRAHFARLARIHAELAARGSAVDTLSMGMSGDFEAAIEAGSTCVRVGTAIFGARAR